jgi:hypothetical protein
MRSAPWLVLALLSGLIACGGGNVTTSGDGGIVDGNTYAEDDANMDLPDAQPRGYDAAIPADCVPGNTQCTNCIDDDNDGRFDGFDPECISGADDREGSFSTGIPGDNKDPKSQDCFFDGDSGAGNDGCALDTCCLLGTCAEGTNCDVSDECVATCGDAAPPGCDCFGCCTVCIPSGCYTVVINPAVAPRCDESVVSDPTRCPVCTPNTECTGGPCGGDTCVLCPGQDPSTLPVECGGERECPAGEFECEVQRDCGDDYFPCINGCCVTPF